MAEGLYIMEGNTWRIVLIANIEVKGMQQLFKIALFPVKGWVEESRVSPPGAAAARWHFEYIELFIKNYKIFVKTLPWFRVKDAE